MQRHIFTQDLIDCDQTTAANSVQINKGCEGGFVNYALKYVERTGIAYRRDYPYVAVSSRLTLSVEYLHELKLVI